MRGRRTELPDLVAVKTEGGLLPVELLQRLAAGDPSLPGLANHDYRLEPQERLSTVINDAWNSLLGSWNGFREALAKEPERASTTGLTRDRWLLPLFHRLDYGRRLPRPSGWEIEGKTFPISHHWEKVPFHLLGYSVDLDHRTPGEPGAAKQSPHSLVQEFLNRSDEHLWGFLSNGFQLRILRDHHSLSRQAYVEFDLLKIFDDEYYSEFRLLWLLCHQSRVAGDKPAECWLERWFELSRQEGVRALNRLRDGVKKTIEVLGTGFLRRPENRELQEALAGDALDKQDYYRELLRLIYRLIFLFVAEDRDALLDPEAEEAARQLYRDFYSTRHLRRLARRRVAGAGHVDLWRALRQVMARLYEGYPPLALTGFDSFLWSERAVPHLMGADLANEDLLEAVWALNHITEGGVHRPVNWRHIGSEELGSVYEALLAYQPVIERKAAALEYQPEIEREDAAFRLHVKPGHERRTTGSYYTPSSLVDCLLDTALDPVLDEAARKPDPASAILKLKVCDPACGSGHFLVAAARRIAARLAAVRAGEDEPSPPQLQDALRDVVSQSIYGIDANEMAVELCKVSLWMEAVKPGTALSFLDHHIRLGNSLLGAVPALLKEGIPDEAFNPREGDDAAYCRDLKKENKKQRTGQLGLYELESREAWDRLGDLATSLLQIESMSDDTVAEVRRKEERYYELVESPGYKFGRLWPDTWCAAFVLPKVPGTTPVTEEIFRRIEINPHSTPHALATEIPRIAAEYQFLHPHLTFPDVFRVPAEGEDPDNEVTGLCGGFDVVLGNPPWERVKLQEKEWFAERDPEIVAAGTTAKRRKQIAKLASENPELHSEWLAAKRKSEVVSALIRESGRFPLCGRGDVNTFSVFSELLRNLLSPKGRVGCIVPTAIATSDTTKYFFADLLESDSLVSLYSFFEIRRFFPDSESREPFCLLTMRGMPNRSVTARVAFDLRDPLELADFQRSFELSTEDIELMNPNTKTCPLFNTRRDAEIAKRVYSRVPVLIKEGDPEVNHWSVHFMRMLDMANDSGLFRSREELEKKGWELRDNRFVKGKSVYLPLYEAKMVHHFDHRFGTYKGQTEAQANRGKLPELAVEHHRNPDLSILPRYWVHEPDVEARMHGRWDHEWLLGWRDVCRSTDERTAIASLIPRAGVGDKFLLMLPTVSPRLAAVLYTNLCAFIFDYQARQKLGGTALKYFVMKQLTLLPPTEYATEASIGAATWLEWFLPRGLELTYTAWDLEPFAKECDYGGAPFLWDENRRFLLRCEIDAAFFHLYGIERDDVDYIMETFAIVKKRDFKKYGDYRTKLMILDIYDRMQHAIDTGEPYQTLLDPPPADPSLAHPPRDKE